MAKDSPVSKYMREIGTRGGKAKTPRKMKAIRRNLKKAQAAKTKAAAAQKNGA